MNTNSNKILYGAIVIVFLLAFVVLGLYVYRQKNNITTNNNSGDTSSDTTDTTPDTSSDENPVSNTSFESEKGTVITLTSPTRGATVASPLKVTGNVPGSWSFEGQFTVRLLDSESNMLAEGPAKLEGDWMTTNQVPFTADLTFNAPASGSMGLLVLEKANPSDLEENADSLSVPIQF